MKIVPAATFVLSFSAFKRLPPREPLLAILVVLGIGLSRTFARLRRAKVDSPLAVIDYMGNKMGNKIDQSIQI